MEKLTIYVDPQFAGGEIRDAQDAVVYRLESAYSPFASQGGSGATDDTQDEGLKGLAKKAGRFAESAIKNRATVHDVLGNTGFMLEMGTVLTKSDLEDLKKLSPGVRKLGPIKVHSSPNDIPVKVMDLEGNLLGWGRRPWQWITRRYLLQSPDGEHLMETKRETWRKPVFSIHRSSDGEQIGWMRRPWRWNRFLIQNVGLILVLGFVLAIVLMIAVSGLFFLLLIPLFIFALVWKFAGRFAKWRFARWARWQEYELEFWGAEKERLQTLFLSLSIARMRTRTKTEKA